MSEGNSELLSVTQVASELGVTRQRVHDLIKNGQMENWESARGNKKVKI
jgi:excisionase family DNA binding protein